MRSGRFDGVPNKSDGTEHRLVPFENGSDVSRPIPTRYFIGFFAARLVAAI